jgi:ABC-type sugar transport system ATPase subunit
MTGLRLTNINKSFDDKVVLKNVSLELGEGELAVLLGPSGCGKSTLLRIIAGLESADSGEIQVAGVRIDQKEPKDRNVALVFQNYALYPHMTVEKNLSFPLRISGMPVGEIRNRVREVSELLGLSDKLNVRPGKLSGGERQRVALGRGIIREPAIFLLDEPLSNLDADLRGRMRREIVTLQKKIKKTLIHVTHDQTEALTMADRIVLMNKGEIVQIGTPPNLYSNPVDLFTAKFIGYPPINTIDSEYAGAIMSNIEPKLAGHSDIKSVQRYIVGIRAEDIIVDENGAFSGSVESCEYLGAQALIRIVTNGATLNAMTPHRNITPGAIIRFKILPDRMLFFDFNTSRRIG